MPKQADPHPAFLAAAPHQRWQGQLRSLFDRLNDEATTHPGRWAGRVLPGGARVALKLREDGRRELRIYRREKPTSEKADSLFEAEVLTFARYFMVLDWTREMGQTREGGQQCTLLERHRQDDFFSPATGE